MLKFALRDIVITSGANAVDENHLLACLLRHADGDWGLMDEHDQRYNDDVLVHERFADRRVTTILLPEER